MADYRSKREKLEAMARQTASPHEAAVAREKLRAMDADPPAGKKTKRRPTTGEDVLTEEMLREAMENLKRTTYRTAYSNFGGASFGFRYGGYGGSFEPPPPPATEAFLFVGGPYHNTVRAARRDQWTVEALTMSKLDFTSPMEATYKRGTYERVTSIDGKPYFIWRG